MKALRRHEKCSLLPQTPLTSMVSWSMEGEKDAESEGCCRTMIALRLSHLPAAANQHAMKAMQQAKGTPKGGSIFLNFQMRSTHYLQPLLLLFVNKNGNLPAECLEYLLSCQLASQTFVNWTAAMSLENPAVTVMNHLELRKSARLEEHKTFLPPQLLSGKRSSALLKCTESRPPGSCTTSFAQPSTNTPEFEKKVLRSLHIMSLRLLEHSDQLDIMLSYLQEPKETDESNIITRPLVDVESFVKFDEELQHSHKKKEQLQRQMIKIGGTSSGDRARRILYKIIADEVAQQFNWTGAGGKMKFSSLECCNVMCSAISKATNEGTLAEAEKAIQTWLRHARERLSKKAAKQRTA
ncbi:uncharacterized protein LOC135376777 isoform X6 [Ornithodoros turicata]|uniref:uncharacterized protein LOC135376777 isoform X6 n=1 Tax=Ornithodoros turicata TaxID=34597 RepID=UPI00313887C6